MADSEAFQSLDGLPPGYPGDWEADVVLRNGSIAHIRPILPSDGEGIRAFHAGQSEESIYLRFFAPLKELPDKDVHRFTHVDYDARAALVVTVRGMIIGIGRYDRLADGHTAEVAFNIADVYQGKGVGSVLLEHLAVAAQERGITRFVADVLPQNRKMMKVFVDAGYEVSHHFDDGVIAVEFTVEPTARSAAVSLAREHRAEAESMSDVLCPRSVAIVGVSRRPDAPGSLVLDNILDGGFTGQIHIVNSETDHVRGLPAYDRVSDITGEVDLAVVAVPAEKVSAVVADCATKGVKALVVLSSGFAESGPEGQARQAELLLTARAAGMRVLGPLSFGLVNNHPEVLLNATIGRHPPRVGSLGLFSQSGGLAVGLTASAAERGLGLSTMVSSGNRVDISGNDMMQYWIDDESTSVVGMYLESIGNPRKFSRIARQLSLRKPVVVVKSDTARNVPPGHRARAPKVSPSAFDALLTQAGVIRARTVHAMMDIAELVAHQPLPRGGRVGVVGNSDGLNQIMVEAARSRGLRVLGEPLRVPLGGTVRDVRAAMEEAFGDEGTDSVVVAFIPPMQASDEVIATTVAHAAWGHEKPCVAAFFGMRDVSEDLRKASEPRPGNHEGRRRIIPVYRTPLDGIEALAAATRYAQWLRSDHGEHLRPSGIDRTSAHHLVERTLTTAREGRLLDEDETRELLSAYGIDSWESIPCADAEEAVAAAQRLGYPVVLRSLAEGIRTLPGAGGVRADLRSPEAVRTAHRGLSEWLADLNDPQLAVQRMAPAGMATVIRSHEDPLFGPVVSFGVAGAPADVLGDLTHRIPPLTEVDLHELVETLRAAPLLSGGHGRPPVDRAHLYELLSRAAALAEDIPEIDSLELNPVMAHTGGAEVLGARIKVAPAPRRQDMGRRALP
ncbi:GNAT family N-acetyltransferase [Austwickia chelonae]|uniref:bifunctional acetate--CoA ligase family protein/GNAT family N-acetyltransferase n=1 Tax=Austwickia chelonae TaxID=100225 RepID=UPI000E274EA0|nr:GNAT family N-acetyltransferase [Austwickia chelonae]